MAAPDLSLLQLTISFGDALDDPKSAQKLAASAIAVPGAVASLNEVPDIRFGVTTTPAFATGAIKQAAGTGQLVFDPDSTDAAAPSSIATNGNLSLTRTPGWRRMVEPGHSVFAGFGGAITPEDSPQEVSSNSASFAYTFSPADTPALPADSLSLAGNMSGEGVGSGGAPGATTSAPSAGTLPAGIPAASASNPLLLVPNNSGANALGYSYRPNGRRLPPNAALPPPSSRQLVNSGLPRSVANIRAASLGASADNAVGIHEAVAPLAFGADDHTPAGTDIAAGRMEAAVASWVLQDFTDAGNGGDPLLARLTIEDYLITNPAAQLPADASGSAGSRIATDDTLTIPMIVVGTGVGELASNLTIFTSEGAGMNGVGEAYVYFSGPPATLTSPASSLAPKVASAVLGVGLVGLAVILRRRQNV